MHPNFSAVALGAIALFAASAHAAEATAPTAEPSMFTFSGFGTVGLVKTNTDDAVYNTGSQDGGATTKASFEPDTKLGLQLGAKFNDTFSATGQLLSQLNAVGTWTPEVEWAFAKANLGAGFSVRAGRIGAPFFMVSDYRSVGYTNVSVRTPPDVYAQVPISHFDGGDMLYQGNFGESTVNAQVFAGKTSKLIGTDTTIVLSNMFGVNASVEYGPITFRAGSVKTKLGAEGSGLDGFNALLGGLYAMGQVPSLESLTTLADDIAIDGKSASFTGVGMVLDWNNIVASAEYTWRRSETLYVSDTTGWYATAGYRIGKWTPYASLSRRVMDGPTSVAGPVVSPALPPIVQGTVPALIAAVNSNIMNNSAQRTTALGVRWDAGKSFDVKAEWARLSVPAGSVGGFSDVQGGSFAVDTNVNVFTIMLDFVF
jgi:hypothetical protein